MKAKMSKETREGEIDAPLKWVQLPFRMEGMDPRTIRKAFCRKGTVSICICICTKTASRKTASS